MLAPLEHNCIYVYFVPDQVQPTNISRRQLGGIEKDIMNDNK